MVRAQSGTKGLLNLWDVQIITIIKTLTHLIQKSFFENSVKNKKNRHETFTENQYNLYEFILYFTHRIENLLY